MASCYWAPVSEPWFLDSQISRFAILDLFLCNLFSEHMLVRYRGINNKGVLGRPWTTWMVSMAMSSTLKFQFTINPGNEKV